MSIEQVQGIPPAPLPLNYSMNVLDAHSGDGETIRLVRLSLSTPAGIGVYFFHPDFAQKFLQDFKVVLHQAKTGIVIAQVIEPENGNGPQA